MPNSVKVVAEAKLAAVREWAEINIDLQPATEFSRGFQGAANRILTILNRSDTR